MLDWQEAEFDGEVGELAQLALLIIIVQGSCLSQIWIALGSLCQLLLRREGLLELLELLVCQFHSDKLAVCGQVKEL